MNDLIRWGGPKHPYNMNIHRREKSMPDPRVTKLAKVMVHYSLRLRPGQQLWLRTTPLAQELNLAIYEEAVKAGAYVWVQQTIPGAEEVFYKYAPDTLLDFVAPVRKLITETFDASLYIE